MKIIFPLIICISFSIYSQQVPTTLSEVYKEEIKYDFSQSHGKLVGTWVEKQSMPYPRYYGASVMYSRNDTTWLYVFGGDTTSNGNATTACLRYNVNADTSWEYIDSLPTPMRVNSAARLGDKLYTMGGFDGLPPDTAVKKFYEYDINTQVWTELPELPEGIFFHKAIGFQDSLIYIIGGVNSDSAIFLNRVLLYNINTQQFRDASPLPEQRANFAVAILGSTIVITGGYFDSDSLSNKTIAAVIDPVDRSQLSYSFKADYPVKVHSHFGYPQRNNIIDFFGGSITTGFNPIDSLYSLRIPAFEFNTGGIIQSEIMAFHSDYSYTNINPNIDSIVTVVIAGGVTSGPSITGKTWVYRDTLTVTGISETGDIPSGFSLMQNYPNPFNPTTIIGWQLPNSSHVSLKIYDVLGNEIAVLINGDQPAGNHQINFNASGLSSGIYFYKLLAGKFTETKKLLLMK